MIGHFPTPYPDELLYSICARYSHRLQYPSKTAVNLELWGARHVFVPIALPSHLDFLIRSLPTGHTYTAQKLIDNHTLFPYYGPFLPTERMYLTIKHMRASYGSAAYRIAGITTSNISPPKYLRYCSTCLLEDKRLFGESYWHRAHQITGVEVCDTHSQFLQNSIVERKASATPPLALSDQVVGCGTIARGVNSQLADHRALINTAKDVRWLLEQSNLIIGFERLRDTYLKILAEKDFATRSRIRLQKLSESFFSNYSPSLLALLRCSPNEVHVHDWLFSLFNRLRISSAMSPLRHLLVVQFLGYTAESFFTLTARRISVKLPTRDKPFGLGPWPCLNPASNHFKQCRVTQCFVSYKRKQNIPVGTFSCECGYVYVRKGPDLSSNNQFCKQKTLRFGPIWESALIELWRDNSLLFIEMARRLGVCPRTLKRHAARIGLPLIRRDSTGKPIEIFPSAEENLQKLHEAKWNKILKHRNDWLNILKENPNAIRSFLERNYKRVFVFLKRHDNGWLQNNLPNPIRKKPAPIKTVDWVERDIKLAQEVRRIASRLRTATSRPVKITRAVIIKELEKPIQTRKYYLTKLPLTIEALAEETESHTDFAIRRINWAANRMREDQIPPTHAMLMTRANVWPIKHIKEVSTAINAAVSFLQGTSVHTGTQAA